MTPAEETREIMEEIAAKYGVSYAALTGGSRKRGPSHARQEAWAVIRERKPHLSYPTLGRIFWRHHSTIMRGLRDHQKRTMQ